MDKQAILNFLQTVEFIEGSLQYAKFYTTYTREIPSLIPSERTNEVSFYIIDEMIHDNMVTKQFLVNHLRVAKEQFDRNDEMEAISGIINPNSEFYSETNVMNEPFTKESLLDSLVRCRLSLPQRNAKYLLVSPTLMVLAKEISTSDLIVNNYPIEVIVNPYLPSTFAAILTNAPNSFRHFLKKPMELSVDKRFNEIEVKLSSERFFEVGNPMGIYTISF